MAYKYQNDIEDAVDVMVKVMGKDKHGKAQQELAEVYRKAEAFDCLYAKFDKENKDLSKAEFDVMHIIKYVDELKSAYDEDKLLMIVKEYKERLKADGIEVNLWYEAVFEAIEALKAKSTTIESFMDDTKTVMDQYKKVHEKAERCENESKNLEAKNIKSFLAHPIFFMQVVYMWNHKHFNGDMDAFAGAGHNDKFVDAIGEG